MENMEEHLKQHQENKANFARYMSNPRCFTLKRWFAEIVREDYPQHDEIIERISSCLLTDKDVDRFGKLIMNVYEKAYKKAVADYQKEFEKMGIKVTLGTEELK